MAKKIHPYLFWAPRVISILLIAFLALMSLDVISPGGDIGQIIIGLIMHNIPVFILIAVLVLSWKFEIVGGIVFILVGLAYILQMILNARTQHFEGYMISYTFIIAGPAILTGILFIANWIQKKSQHS